MTKDAVLGSPVDPTTTAAWDTLEETAQEFVPDIGGWFAADPKRAQRYTLTAGDLHVDLSKNLITPSVLDQLMALAEQTGVTEHRDQMFEGARINVTEDRSVLHTALRRPEGEALLVDGADVMPAVHAELKKVYSFADQVRDGPGRESQANL